MCSCQVYFVHISQNVENVNNAEKNSDQSAFVNGYMANFAQRLSAKSFFWSLFKWYVYMWYIQRK